jgi:serine/threonine protein kinase
MLDAVAVRQGSQLTRAHFPPHTQDPEQYSKAFRHFLSCCLQPDPKLRYSAAQLLNVRTPHLLVGCATARAHSPTSCAMTSIRSWSKP